MARVNSQIAKWYLFVIGLALVAGLLPAAGRWAVESGIAVAWVRTACEVVANLIAIVGLGWAIARVAAIVVDSGKSEES